MRKLYYIDEGDNMKHMKIIVLLIAISIIISCKRPIIEISEKGKVGGLYIKNNCLFYTLLKNNNEYCNRYIDLRGIMRKRSVKCYKESEAFLDWNSTRHLPTSRYEYDGFYLDVHMIYPWHGAGTHPGLKFSFHNSEGVFFEKSIKDTKNTWISLYPSNKKYYVNADRLYFLEKGELLCVNFVVTAKKKELDIVWKVSIDIRDYETYILSGNDKYIALKWDNKIVLYDAKTGEKEYEDIQGNIVYMYLNNKLLNYIKKGNEGYRVFHYDIFKRRYDSYLIKKDLGEIIRCEDNIIIYLKDNGKIYLYDYLVNVDYATNHYLAFYCLPFEIFKINENIFIQDELGWSIISGNNGEYRIVKEYNVNSNNRGQEKSNNKEIKTSTTEIVLNSIANDNYIIVNSLIVEAGKYKSNIIIIKKSKIKELY